MRMRVLRALGISVFVGMGGVHAATAPTQAVALRLSDLPVGFTQTAGHFVSNAQAEKGDHLPAGTLARHGRLSAHEADFRTSAIAGLLNVQSTVTYWRATAGAQWQLSTSQVGPKRPAGMDERRHHFAHRLRDQRAGAE
jgi:hypothetical protein